MRDAGLLRDGLPDDTAQRRAWDKDFYDCNGHEASRNMARSAQAACAAYTGNASACTPSSTCCGIPIGNGCLGTTATSECGTAGGKCYCWQYAGPQQGKVKSEGSKAARPAVATGWN